MDYKKLLIAYMARVMECEMIDYIEDGSGRLNLRDLGLNDDEVAELKKISEQASELLDTPAQISYPRI
ncbi:MAG: hypothetical protein CFE27_14810 [Alphaproteobacteria bacterium PA1]|nr:MAG: hypothetical protein CFE27_14810 [Alphaproteobacteria bacterium PA1]